MAEGFLSQGEVDALLKGVDDDEFSGDATALDAGSVRPYNLATQERIVPVSYTHLTLPTIYSV